MRLWQGWMSMATKSGKPVLELLGPSSTLAIRRGEQVLVQEVYVSGDRGTTAGGRSFIRCERGWAATHDRLEHRLLEPQEAAAAPPPLDVRNLPWTYMYFYGLFAHKLAHFFDVVHGTRHE